MRHSISNARLITAGIRNVLVVASIVFGSLSCFAQSFTNLDFEYPILPLNPVNGFVPTADAIPGWTAYTYGLPSSSVSYNDVSLGAAEVSLQGPGSLEPIVQGKYTIILQGSTGSTPGTAAIGQTGLIPANVVTLVFWGAVGNNAVSINGQTLSLAQIGSTPNYYIYAADISAFAGQTDQLLFTAPVGSSGIIDNIMFSTFPVPEPATCALILAGIAFLGLKKARGRGRETTGDCIRSCVLRIGRRHCRSA